MQIDFKQPGPKITATLFAGQSFSSAAMIAVSTVLTIGATELSGDPSQAGLPNAISKVVAAAAAFLWGILWDRIGRRKGMVIGLLFGSLGAILGIVAFQTRSFLLLIVAVSGMGVSRSAMQLSRFIAAEVTPPQYRGQAISFVIFGGTIGAVLGPLLVAPSSRLALFWGLPELAGPFLFSLAIFLLASQIMYIGLNPEPKQVSEQIAQQYPEFEAKEGQGRRPVEIFKQSSVLLAVISMVVAQAVMTIIMGMTALYMNDHGHSLNAISIVFSAHTLGMFAFSVVSGNLADRWGRGQMIVLGSILLLLSFALAPLSLNTWMLALALFLLGLGWNFCFVAGSALLSDNLRPVERSRFQGTNDLVITFVSAFVSYASGLVYSKYGFKSLNLLSAVATVPVLMLTAWWMQQQKRTPKEKQFT